MREVMSMMPISDVKKMAKATIVNVQAAKVPPTSRNLSVAVTRNPMPPVGRDASSRL